MDLRNLASTPNPLDIQRRPSLSSLSSTSGYGSSNYGGIPSNGNTPQLTGQNSRVNPKNLNLNNYGDYQSNQQTNSNVWMNHDNGVNDVAPWVELQKQQHSKVGSLDLEKDKKDVKDSKLGSASPQKDDDSVDSDDHDDDLIPTAIVIKNIPFAIKKEQLLDVMTKLNLPLPYAFNYHFDNGVFRGLAFANFTSTDETSMVVNQLNGREIGGRKLRVEYKKMLPAQERERIEREKREKRGQLEEQHRSTSTASLASMISATSTTAATKNLSVNGTTSQPERMFLNFPSTNGTLTGPLPSDVNFNDIEVLELYTQLVVFKDDNCKTIMELAFPPTLSVGHRKILSTLCAWLNLLELYDNGLAIIRKKPGQVFLVLNSGTPEPNGQSGSMINLTQLNQAPGLNMGSSTLPGTGPHPELLRSHSQTTLPMPRLRQQNSSTPTQQQFPQYSGNGNGPATGAKLYQGIQPFGFMSSSQQSFPSQVAGFSPSTSAAAILRNGSGSSRPTYGDIRATPPLTGSFVTESPTPTPQQAHSNLFNPNPATSSTNNSTPTPPGSSHNSISGTSGTNNGGVLTATSTGGSTVNGTNSNSNNNNKSQPSTPLQSHDLNSRFAPFGQHTGSFTSLPSGGLTGSRHSDEFNDLTGKFNSININYDPSTAPSTGSSGIWGPK